MLWQVNFKLLKTTIMEAKIIKCASTGLPVVAQWLRLPPTVAETGLHVQKNGEWMCLHNDTPKMDAEDVAQFNKDKTLKHNSFIQEED